jgi:AraC family transcriptional regulator, ethanolamine operon transcriptional activator
MSSIHFRHGATAVDLSRSSVAIVPTSEVRHSTVRRRDVRNRTDETSGLTQPPRDAQPTKSARIPGSAVQFAQTQDIDEQASLLRGWNQTYDQISAGAFQGAFLEINLDRTQLFREVTSNALYQTGGLSARTVAVGVPLALRGNATFCGRRCDGSQLHVFSGSDAFEFFSPCGLDIAGFVFDADDFRAALTDDEQETMTRILAKPHLRSMTQECADRLKQLFADACDAHTQYPGCRAAMTRDIAAALTCALMVERTDSREAVPEPRRSRIVRQARELAAQGRDGSPVTVEELCRSVGVSRRALQYCFLETLGIGPSAYLRTVRLNGARRAIKHAGSVADAAALWGFWHFGRFARDYRSMFGELPSEAFRRMHG